MSRRLYLKRTAQLIHTTIMPVQVSPLIRGARWSALFVGVAYGSVHNRTITKRRREDIAVAEKKHKEEAELRAAKKLAEENAPSILQ